MDRESIIEGCRQRMFKTPTREEKTMMYAYLVILEADGELYSVAFPDLPDCYTSGEGLPDALHMGEDVLSGYLSRYEELQRLIPALSKFSAK